MADNKKNDIIEEEDDFSPDLISLIDDDGNENDFEIIDALELDGNTYIALLQLNEDGTDYEDSEYLILREEIDEEKGETFYLTIENEDEFRKVITAFNESANKYWLDN